MMKKFVTLIALIAIGFGLAEAVDQRDGSNSVQFLAPDPSLKTSDSFYTARGAQSMGYTVQNGINTYDLPDIFSMPLDAYHAKYNVDEKVSDHDEKMKDIVYIANNSYDLTEYQMQRANVTLGSENYL